MVTNNEEIRQMIQTVKETIKEDEISEQVEIRKHLVHTVGEKGNISPQKIAQHGEKDVESVERRTTLQRFGNKKHQLNCTNWSIQKSHLAMRQHTLSKRKLRMLKQKRSDGWRLY